MSDRNELLAYVNRLNARVAALSAILELIFEKTGTLRKDQLMDGVKKLEEHYFETLESGTVEGIPKKKNIRDPCPWTRMGRARIWMN